MALPVSNVAAGNEDELADEFDTTGYVQLPADHLSDWSDSSHGTACDASLESLSRSSTVPQAEDLAITNNAGGVTHINDSTPCCNGGHFSHSSPEGEAVEDVGGVVAHIDVAARDYNGRHLALINGMNGREATDDDRSSYQSGGSVVGVALEGAAIPSDELHDNSGHVVHFDGMKIHVYGQLARLQLSSHTNSHLGSNDGGEEELQDEDVVDESERQRAEDAAFQRAKEADDARRSAPLPQDRCQAIKTAMLNISLGGFRPEWADRVPEDQWINRLREKSVSETFSK